MLPDKSSRAGERLAHFAFKLVVTALFLVWVKYTCFMPGFSFGP